jgi:hypothetical protein
MFLHEFAEILSEFLRPYGIQVLIPQCRDDYLGGRCRVMFFDQISGCALLPERFKSHVVPVLTNEGFFKRNGIPVEMRSVPNNVFARLLILGDTRYILTCKHAKQPVPRRNNTYTLIVQGKEMLLPLLRHGGKDVMWDIYASAV